MNSPSTPAPDSPEAGDIDTESLYGAPPDGSNVGSDVDATDSESGPPDDVPIATTEPLPRD